MHGKDQWKEEEQSEERNQLEGRRAIKEEKYGERYVYMQKVQNTPLKYRQSLDKPLNYILVQFTS